MTAPAFFLYGFAVEQDQPCFSDGQGSPRTLPNSDDTDVAKAFRVVIFGYAGVSFVDIVVRLARILIPKVKALMELFKIINFFIIVGFFIAIHVVRFRGSGEVCSESLLKYRGAFLQIYIIAAWSLFGAVVVATLTYGCIRRR